MKKFVVIVKLNRHIFNTFVIVAESVEHPEFKSKLFQEIDSMADGSARDTIYNELEWMNRTDDVDPDEYVFESLEIYEVVQSGRSTSGFGKTDVAKNIELEFIKWFRKQEEERDARKKAQDIANDRQLYERLKKQFEP